MVENAEDTFGLVDLQRVVKAAHQIQQREGKTEYDAGCELIAVQWAAALDNAQHQCSDAHRSANAVGDAVDELLAKGIFGDADAMRHLIGIFHKQNLLEIGICSV